MYEYFTGVVLLMMNLIRSGGEEDEDEQFQAWHRTGNWITVTTIYKHNN